MKNVFIIFLIFYFSTAAFSQSSIIIRNDSLNFAVLVIDYSSYKLEEGNLSYYEPLKQSISKIPVTSVFETPVDYGSITFLYTKNQDTLFSAGVDWQQQGNITFPRNFLPADSFSIMQNQNISPLSTEYYYNDMYGSDTSSYKMKADSAWLSVKALNIVNQFSRYPFRVGLYLYTPEEGAMISPGITNNLLGAKWIVFLFYDSSTITGVRSEDNQPAKFVLSQNYPNPFNPSTVIHYSVPKTSNVRLALYNPLGQVIMTLVNKVQLAGQYEVYFNSYRLASGPYFYSIIEKPVDGSKELQEARKMMLMK